jgi:flotillin
MCFDMGVATCGPNEALIISGVGYSNGPKIVAGGRLLVIPCIHRVQRLSLVTLTLEVTSTKVYTVLGVPISVTGIAQVIC